MEVGIIGAGMIGGTLARRLAERGAHVALGTRRATDARLAALPVAVARVTPAEAARFGAATIIAVPFSAWPALIADLGAALDGRVVLDTSNASPGRDGAEADRALVSGAGSGAAVAALLPRARIVKAFNTVHFATLATGGTPPIAIPLAGNDAAAVAIAASVVAAAGFAPVPAGPLRAAARFDFGTPLFNRAMGERDLRHALSLPHQP
jgi:predicted dinucleotide-binding enzyme